MSLREMHVRENFDRVHHAYDKCLLLYSLSLFDLRLADDRRELSPRRQ